MILRPLATRRGLSLIEVLLALAILVMSLAAIGRLVDIGTERGNDARLYTRGARLAQAKMAEVEAGVIAVSSESSGQFDGDDSVWSYTVSPTQAQGNYPNLYTVTVTVTRDFGGRHIEVNLVQMIFDPSMMGSAAQAEVPATPDTTSGTTSGTTGTSP
jgi:general secretion pathway protein I